MSVSFQPWPFMLVWVCLCPPNLVCVAAAEPPSDPWVRIANLSNSSAPQALARSQPSTTPSNTLPVCPRALRSAPVLRRPTRVKQAFESSRLLIPPLYRIRKRSRVIAFQRGMQATWSPASVQQRPLAFSSLLKSFISARLLLQLDCSPLSPFSRLLRRR
jgi:hypothetical protein